MRSNGWNGVDEIRTHNLLDATEALSQLSYHPRRLHEAVVLAGFPAQASAAVDNRWGAKRGQKNLKAPCGALRIRALTKEKLYRLHGVPWVAAAQPSSGSRTGVQPLLCRSIKFNHWITSLAREQVCSIAAIMMGRADADVAPSRTVAREHCGRRRQCRTTAGRTKPSGRRACSRRPAPAWRHCSFPDVIPTRTSQDNTSARSTRFLKFGLKSRVMGSGESRGRLLPVQPWCVRYEHAAIPEPLPRIQHRRRR